MRVKIIYKVTSIYERPTATFEEKINKFIAELEKENMYVIDIKINNLSDYDSTALIMYDDKYEDDYEDK